MRKASEVYGRCAKGKTRQKKQEKKRQNNSPHVNYLTTIRSKREKKPSSGFPHFWLLSVIPAQAGIHFLSLMHFQMKENYRPSTI
jgi:hypothetical protein